MLQCGCKPSPQQAPVLLPSQSCYHRLLAALLYPHCSFPAVIVIALQPTGLPAASWAFSSSTAPCKVYCAPATGLLPAGLRAVELQQGVLQGGGHPWEAASRAAGRQSCPGLPRAGARRRLQVAHRHSILEAAQILGLARSPCRAAAALLMDLHGWHMVSGIYTRSTRCRWHISGI